MQLIEYVRKGYRPQIPSNASKFMSGIVQECWQNESVSRPHASEVSRLLAQHLDKLGSCDVHENFNSTPTTVVSEQSSTSMPVEEDINIDPTDTVSTCVVTQLKCINASNATISLYTIILKF